MGGYNYDWSIITKNMDVFIDGALKTLEISAIALLIAIPIGIIFGLGRISRNKFIRLISSIYVEVMRGVPLLVLLFWIFFVLGQFVRLGSYWAAILGLAIFSGAFIAEIVQIGNSSSTKRANGGCAFIGHVPHECNAIISFCRKHFVVCYLLWHHSLSF